MSAPKITGLRIAAPCAPRECHTVETGHAIRQLALIASAAPAPYRPPPTVGRVTSEFRNSELNNTTRIPPASVLPIPQAKPMIHGATRSISLTCDGTRRTGSFAGLIENVSTVTNTTPKTAETAAQ